MGYLLGATLLWAFSFGLIKNHLTALDPWLVASVRLALAAVAFAPWAVGRRPTAGIAARAAVLGGLQFGLMYGLYVAAFRFLAAHEVALWTIFTPLYVVLLTARERRGRAWRAPAAASLAVAAAAVVLADGRIAAAWEGVLLVQASNLCFAAGQVVYPRLATRAYGRRENPPRDDAALLGWMYVGGAALATTLAVPSLAEGQGGLPTRAWFVLAYLGLVPTALGFALWNRGAARTGSGILAVANNLKIPLAVLVSWLVFGESVDPVRMLAGVGLAAAAVALAGSRTTKE